MGYFDFYPYSEGRLVMTFVVGAGAAVFLVLLGLLHTEQKLRCEWDYSRAKSAADTARVDAIVLHVGVTADSLHRVIPHTCREFRGPVQ